MHIACSVVVARTIIVQNSAVKITPFVTMKRESLEFKKLLLDRHHKINKSFYCVIIRYQQPIKNATNVTSVVCAPTINDDNVYISY